MREAKMYEARGSNPGKHIEEFLRQDEFNQHKFLYELHAATWLLAQSQGDVALHGKSAKQMLFHLQKMYGLATLERGIKDLAQSPSLLSQPDFTCAGN